MMDDAEFSEVLQEQLAADQSMPRRRCRNCADVEASRDTLKAAIEQYLEWGAMTGSDRDLFERKFRAALAACVPPQETEK